MFTFGSWVSTLLKARGHRYIKRIPYMSRGKKRYRYVYKVTHTHRGRHILDPNDMKEGAKFMIRAEKGEEIHAHITRRLGDVITVTYDDGPRKGQSETMHVNQLVRMIDQGVDVGTKIREQRERVTADIEQAQKTGTKKQIALLEKRRTKIDRLIDEAGLMIDHPAYKRGGSPFMAFIEALLDGRDTIAEGEYEREIELLLKSGLIAEGDETPEGVRYEVTERGRAKYDAYIEEKIDEAFDEKADEDLPDLIPDTGDEKEPSSSVDTGLLKTPPRRRLPDLGEVILGARKMMSERELTTAEMRKSFTRDKLTGWRGIVEEADTLEESGNTPSASILKQAIISSISATPFKLGKNDPSVVLQWTATGETATENAGLVYKDGVAFVMKSLEACKTEQDVLTFLYEWSELASLNVFPPDPVLRDRVFTTFDDANQNRELHDGIMSLEIGRYGDLIPKSALSEDEREKKRYAKESSYAYGVRDASKETHTADKYFHTEEEALAYARSNPNTIIDITRTDHHQREGAVVSYTKRSNVARGLTANDLTNRIARDQGETRYKNSKFGEVPEELRRQMHLMTQILAGVPTAPNASDVEKVAKRYGSRLTDPAKIERAVDNEFQKRRSATVKRSAMMNLIFRRGAYSHDVDKELKFPPSFRLKALNDLFDKAKELAGKSWDDPAVTSYFERSAVKKKTGWRFKREASGSAKRVGGSPVPANVTQEMIESQMNLRGIQWGKSMTRTDQDTHVVNSYGALTDLAGVLGVPVDRMGLNGDLALAYGARGRGGGTKAHYEPQARVINLTRQAGAGSLAHEWGHALDHALHTHYGIERPSHALADSRGNTNGANLVSVQVLHAEHNPSLANKVPSRVLEAYKGVINAIMYSPAEKPTQEQIEAVGREILDTDLKMRTLRRSARTAYRSADKMHEGRSEQSYLDEHNDLVKKYNNLVEKRSLMRKQQDPEDQKYFDPKRVSADVLQGMRDRAREAREKAPTRYHEDSVEVGNGRGYWCGVDEMFARAFESYVEDELQTRGQQNTYLVSGTQTIQKTGKSSTLTPDGEDAQIYPQGEERQRINNAMRNLLSVLSDEGVIKKAFSPRFSFSRAVDTLLRRATP